MEPLEQRQVLAGNIGIEDVADQEGTIAEFPGGYVAVTVPVTYTGDAVAGGFDVSWNVSFPTVGAMADSVDFRPGTTSGTIHFEATGAPAQETKFITLQVAADRFVERTETYFVNLTGVPAGITVVDGQAEGTIDNDDSAEIQVHVSAGGGPYASDYYVEGPEGNTGTNPVYNIKFFLTNPVDVSFSFDYDFTSGIGDFTDGTAWATQGVDYNASSDTGTITFSAYDEGYGLVPSVLTITYQGDDIVERLETFSLILANLQAQGRSVSLPTNGLFFIES